jgi:peptidoglycan/LPS O-acetylase OafA/YrhL
LSQEIAARAELKGDAEDDSRTDGLSEPDAKPPAPRAAEVPHRNDSLDGLRAIAVLMVMAVHIGFPLAEPGWLGVDIFFALSGFLITTLLASERERHGRISLPRFWARRFLRLMPIYWLYIGSLTAAMLLGPPANLHVHGGWTPARYILSLWAYFVNYAPKGGIWTARPGQELALHLWSLAVEEQFYFVWPVLCVFILRFRRAWLFGLALLALIFGARHVDPANGHSLGTRGVGIVMGSTLALYLRDRRSSAWLLKIYASAPVRWSVVAIMLASFLVIGAFSAAHRITTDGIQIYLLPSLCLLYAFAIGMFWRGPLDGLARALSWRPLAALGRISYGVYLYHMLAQYLVWSVLLRGIDSWNKIPKYGLRCGAYLAVTTAMAIASYRLIEQPFLRIKDRLR